MNEVRRSNYRAQLSIAVIAAMATAVALVAFVAFTQ